MPIDSNLNKSPPFFLSLKSKLTDLSSLEPCFLKINQTLSSLRGTNNYVTNSRSTESCSNIIFMFILTDDRNQQWIVFILIFAFWIRNVWSKITLCLLQETITALSAQQVIVNDADTKMLFTKPNDLLYAIKKIVKRVKKNQRVASSWYESRTS